LQGANISLKKKLYVALVATKDFAKRVMDPGSLIKDPDALYFFRNKNGITEIESTPDSKDNGVCPVCTNNFNDSLAAQRAHCGHILCKPCLDHWLLECKRTYTCPLCRACVVCSTNNCKHHIVYRDVAPPIPMPRILDRVAPHRAGQELHGICPVQYWTLRETTRGHRASLAWIERKLESATVTQGDLVYERYVKEAEQLMEMVTIAFEAAVGEPWYDQES
jgi:hypothetical protein